jgi:hypothetical protein
MTNKKRVYLFREGNATMRDLLGGKGANLAEMTNIGLPVPPGFTITTETCNEYTKLGQLPDGLWEEVVASLADVEKDMGKKLGDSNNPLLVSVRSGAKFSMPGMMDTVLNLGLNDDTLKGIIAATGNDRFARSDSPEIDAHGKESLNFQISMLIYNVIAGVLCLVLIGFIILAILHIMNLVLVIIASIQTSEGKFYRYPMTIRLIK